jgi:hypothetical protein
MLKIMDDDIIKEYKAFEAEQHKPQSKTNSYNKAYSKIYYENNKERLLENQKEYHKKNWDKIKATQYLWQKNNPEKWAAVRARTKANRILKDLEYKKTHPELYKEVAQGKYRKIRISKYTPEERLERRRARTRAQWQKDKADPIKILQHRNRSLVYFHKMYYFRKKQKLRARLIDSINQLRLTKIKKELYADIQAKRGGDGHQERISPVENKGDMGNRTSKWRETLRSLLKKRLS